VRGDDTGIWINKNMFPDYLEEKSIVKDEDKITIYFKSIRKSCKCSNCNISLNTIST